VYLRKGGTDREEQIRESGIESLSGLPRCPATINRELACLKAMYFHALKDRHDFGNPVSEVEFLPENNEQNRVLSFEEQQKYLRRKPQNEKFLSTPPRTQL